MSSLSDTITGLIKGNTTALTLGMNDKHEVWVSMQHLVETCPGGRMEITHKALTSNVVDSITQIAKQYKDIEDMKPSIVQLPARKVVKA